MTITQMPLESPSLLTYNPDTISLLISDLLLSLPARKTFDVIDRSS
ncbi:MAG: hypothetical protein ABIE74_01555 [Pseudomonadota bacterium]